MKRRAFITLLGGAAAAWPLAVRAQQPRKTPTVGLLGATTPAVAGQWIAAFAQRLHELGWTEGRTVAIEYRFAEGRNEQMAEIVPVGGEERDHHQLLVFGQDLIGDFGVLAIELAGQEHEQAGQAVQFRLSK